SGVEKEIPGTPEPVSNVRDRRANDLGRQPNFTATISLGGAERLETHVRTLPLPQATPSEETLRHIYESSLRYMRRRQDVRVEMAARLDFKSFKIALTARPDAPDTPEKTVSRQPEPPPTRQRGD